MTRKTHKPVLALLLMCVAVLAGCRNDMRDQPRYKPLQQADFFGDDRSARAPLAGTVARGQLRDDALYFTGRSGTTLADTLPFPVTKEVLERGRERYNIHCTPCHDRTGNGQGMVVQRGFRQPPSFHIDRLRQAPVGHYYDVMTNGFGAMSDYAARVAPRDRWAIAAYIRALQYSQRAALSDVPADKHGELDKAPQSTQPAAGGEHGQAPQQGGTPQGQQPQSQQPQQPQQQQGAPKQH